MYRFLKSDVARNGTGLKMQKTDFQKKKKIKTNVCFFARYFGKLFLCVLDKTVYRGAHLCHCTYGLINGKANQ